jgi:hypothetical protein
MSYDAVVLRPYTRSEAVSPVSESPYRLSNQIGSRRKGRKLTSQVSTF